MSMVSRFTPSLQRRELLEQVFVARDDLLDRILDRVVDAAASVSRNHTLLVGPRGSGKTHLLALAYYRICDLIDNGAKVQVAWLPEDPWGIVSYRHLLAEIRARLEPDQGADQFRHLDAESLEAQIRGAVDRYGPVVVLVENLDRILEQIGEIGQQRLRHLLQAHLALLLVATTTTVDRNLSDPARPFYGFFTTTKLAPFTVEQAQQMLQALARARGEDDLANELTTPRMRARVEAIAHLAGGQPRMWAVVSEGLDLEIHQLDRLVDLLLTRFDDLTPYYQERLARLAPQQRLVIIELAGADHPRHVAELARRLGIDQRSLGKTVTELNDAGWIAPVRTPITDMMDRRRTYYELSEPLLRIAFQIKDTRGEPLPMVIDFLKGWFDPNQLTQHRGSSPDQDVYLAQAVDSLQTDPLPHVSRWLSGLAAQRVPALGLLATIDDALHALNEGDADAFLALPVSLRTALETQLQASDVTATTSSLRAHIHTAALEEVGDTPTEEPSVDQEWIARAETLAALPGHTGLERLLGWLIHSWSFPEAKAVLYALTETLGPGHPVAFTARSNLAHATGQAGDPAAAVAGFEGLLHDAERVFGRDDC